MAQSSDEMQTVQATQIAGKFQSAKVATKAEYNIQKNFDEIVGLITNIPDDTIDLKLHKIEQRNISEEVDFWEFLDTYSELNVYCDKTGNMLETIEDKKIKLLLRTHDISRVKFLLDNYKRNRVDPNWIFTDNTALNALCESDPIGYFVYAASQILRCYQPQFQQQTDKTKHDPAANDKWRADKAACNKILRDNYGPNSQIQPTELIEVNELMRRYLSLMQTLSAINQVKFSETCRKLPQLPNNLAQFKTEIIASIESVIHYAYRLNNVKTTLTYDDINRLNLRFQGHSNFRRQNTLKGMTDIDAIMMIVEQHTPQMKSLQRKIAMNQFEDRVKELQQKQPAIKHKGGAINLIPAPKKAAPFELSFAQLLGQKRK